MCPKPGGYLTMLNLSFDFCEMGLLILMLQDRGQLIVGIKSQLRQERGAIWAVGQDGRWDQDSLTDEASWDPQHKKRWVSSLGPHVRTSGLWVLLSPDPFPGALLLPGPGWAKPPSCPSPLGCSLQGSCRLCGHCCGSPRPGLFWTGRASAVHSRPEAGGGGW